MPRDGNGVYSKPAGTTATPNTLIESSKYNAFCDDLVTDANAARPITAGGTGGNTAATARTALAVPGLAVANTFTASQTWAEGAAIASAATLTLGTDGNFFHVTGTTTITAIDGAASPAMLVFDGILTLTHNATSLILPGAANITTAAGDVAVMVSEGSGNWRCTDYQYAASPPASAFIHSGTPIATTSGTQINSAADIAPWAQRVIVILSGVSTNGTDGLGLQCGTSGGIENTGYASGISAILAANTTGIAADTNSFLLVSTTAAASTYSGRVVLEKVSGNTWQASSSVSATDTGVSFFQNGNKTFSGVLDRFRLISGGDTFDAGTLKYFWE